MRVRVGLAIPQLNSAGKHGRAVSRYPNDTACTIGRADGCSVARWLFGGEGAQTRGAELPTT